MDCLILLTFTRYFRLLVVEAYSLGCPVRMVNYFPLPNGCTIRPAEASDKRRLYNLLQQFDRESAPNPSPFSQISQYLGLGMLIAVGGHILLTQGLSAIVYPLGLVGLGWLIVRLATPWIQVWKQFWVLDCEGQIVACAKLCCYPTYSVLYNVLVAREWRNRGLGSTIVRYVARQARGPLYLACVPRRIRFYNRLGFVQVRPQRLSPTLQQDLGLSATAGIVPLVLK